MDMHRIFATRGDTIFRKLYAVDSFKKQYSYLMKTYVAAPAAGSYTYKTSGLQYTEITVKKLTDPVVTPAGTFNSCYQYTYSNPNESVEEIVYPGLGVVKITEQGDGPTGHWQHVRTLIHYKLNRL